MNKQSHHPASSDNGLDGGVVCVAPMMAWTDAHCRFLHRLCSPSAKLFTEMVHADAVLRQPQGRWRTFDKSQHPLVLQLGGNDPIRLADAAKLAEQCGFDEVNLNVGCPSPRVASGAFGAALMRDPGLVGRCVEAMCRAVTIPITVKCRLGVDEDDSQTKLKKFVSTVADSGCELFYVHARKAFLNGLNPAQNRSVPPLQWERVADLRRSFVDLRFVLNGGITDAAVAQRLARDFHGVMIGRAAYSNPLILWEIHAQQRGISAPLHRGDILAAYTEYVERMLSNGVLLSALCKPVLGLCSGLRGARQYRRTLSDHHSMRQADHRVLQQAFAFVEAA